VSPKCSEANRIMFGKQPLVHIAFDHLTKEVEWKQVVEEEVIVQFVIMSQEHLQNSLVRSEKREE
jgi:hypothetical protein